MIFIKNFNVFCHGQNNIVFIMKGKLKKIRFVIYAFQKPPLSNSTALTPASGFWSGVYIKNW